MPTKEIAPGVLAVTELPKDAIKIVVFQSKELWYTFNDRECTDEDIIPLPPGSWSLLGKASELTYEQKGFICKRENGYFEDYCGDGYLFTSVTLSFASLLRSHGITDRALIIKKEK